MAAKNEVFLLGKITALEYLTSQLLIGFAQLAAGGNPRSLLADMHHNCRESARTRLNVLDGDTEATDPIEVQQEVIAAVDRLFAVVNRHLETD